MPRGAPRVRLIDGSDAYTLEVELESRVARGCRRRRRRRGWGGAGAGGDGGDVGWRRWGRGWRGERWCGRHPGTTGRAVRRHERGLSLRGCSRGLMRRRSRSLRHLVAGGGRVGGRVLRRLCTQLQRTRRARRLAATNPWACGCEEVSRQHLLRLGGRRLGGCQRKVDQFVLGHHGKRRLWRCRREGEVDLRFHILRPTLRTRARGGGLGR